MTNVSFLSFYFYPQILCRQD